MDSQDAECREFLLGVSILARESGAKEQGDVPGALQEMRRLLQDDINQNAQKLWLITWLITSLTGKLLLTYLDLTWELRRKTLKQNLQSFNCLYKVYKMETYLRVTKGAALHHVVTVDDSGCFFILSYIGLCVCVSVYRLMIKYIGGKLTPSSTKDLETVGL